MTDGVLAVDNFGWALLAALVVAAVSVVLAVFLGSDDTYVDPHRAADRAPAGHHRRAPTFPGSSTSRSTGSRCRCCAGRCATATRRTWRAGWPRTRTGWPSGRPTSPRRRAPARRGSCSARTRTSRRSAGWRRRPATMMTCSAPPDCAEIERRRATGIGLLVDGGASRGNLLSGEADDVILTVSRMEEEKKSNPGYRAFFANGDNVDAHARPLRLGGHPRVDGRAARDPPRRAAARPPRRHLPADAGRALRLRARPDRLRRPHRHDARAARRLRDVLELRRGRAPLGSRARRHARGAAQARRPVRATSSARAATRRGRTRSSSSPTTGRRRARRSSSATATASTSSSSARSRRATSPGSPAATSRARWSATPSARRPGRRRSRPRTTSPTATSSCSARATSASST